MSTKIIEYLPEDAQQDQFLKTLVGAYQEVVVDKLNDSLERLLKIRDFTQVDDEVVPALLRDLGLTIETSNFTNAERRRLLSESLHFYRVLGTSKTADFLSYTTNSVFEFRQLWTNDYVEFVRNINDQLPDDFYPTNHILVSYDIDKFSGDPLLVRNLFYTISPINWVLQNLVVEYNIDEVVPNSGSDGDFFVTVNFGSFEETTPPTNAPLFYNGVATFDGNFSFNGVRFTDALDELIINIV